VVIVDRGRVLLAQRPSKGLLGGMWEFPNARVEGDSAKELTNAINAAYRLKVRRKEALGVVQHAYTHFKVTVHAFRCESVSIPKSKNLKWVKLTDLDSCPMGKVDRQIARIMQL
jgi:A/G-specific adenine glycosylase